MKLIPMIVVSDVARSADFYTRLGLPVRLRSRNAHWLELDVPDGARIGLHAQRSELEQVGAYGLTFLADRPLEAIAADLEHAGVELPQCVVDEAYGRSLLLADPDGTPVRIVEFDEELYR